MDTSQIFIVGAKGQLGIALQAQYPNARSADIDELDITDKKSVETYDWSNIKVILNAAAFTNVDGAETPDGRITAWKVNATAVGYLVDVARQNNIILVHISTDYVFDGTQTPHTEEESFSPLSVYGASKAAGDLLVSSLEKHYILRTSWVIGEGKNFVRTMLGLGHKNIAPTVVADQFGRLTFTSELVRAIDHVLSHQSPFGTYNLSNDGPTVSWADITRAIFKEVGFDLKVSDATTAEYFAGKEGIAPRPLNSILDLSKIQEAGFKSKDWQNDLHDYLKKELQ
jgi:dTDP-4-dehydrorhamnose 3,5-epimerase/reductase